MIVGTTKIEKCFDEIYNSDYISFIDLEKPEYEYREYSNGTKFWLKNGERHRDGDEPAIIWPNGTKYWYKNGERHRDGDEPAIIRPNGSKEWYKNDKLHRDGDEPAAIWANGTKEWWENGAFIKEL